MAMKLYSDISVQNIANAIRRINGVLASNGYTRLEYVASDGDQYIDMGFKANQDTKILLDFQQTEVFTSAKWFFGARASSTSKCYAFLVGSDQNYATPYNKGSGCNTFLVDEVNIPNDTNRHVMIKQRLNDGSTKMGTFDGDNVLTYGTAIKTSTAYEIFETPVNVVLFNGVQGTTHYAGVVGKIFECKVWLNGNVLTRDLVPVKRNSDNEIGFFDVVNNVFYGNLGTGSFTGGDEWPKYKIGEMADAIYDLEESAKNMMSYILKYVPTLTLSGTTNQGTTFSNGCNLPLKNFSVSGNSSQSGTPTVSNAVPVVSVNSISIEIDNGDGNSRSQIFDLNGNELYQLGDGTTDSLYVSNGHLYIDKKIKKVKLTSSQSWSLYARSNGAYCPEFSTTYGIEKLNYNMYSNHFTPSSTVWDQGYHFGWGSASPNTTLWLTFNATTSEFTTLDAFKAWLDEHDCYIVAKMSVPTTIDLGEIDLISTYEGTNNVTVTTNLGTTYELEYRES